MVNGIESYECVSEENYFYEIEKWFGLIRYFLRAGVVTLCYRLLLVLCRKSKGNC